MSHLGFIVLGVLWAGGTNFIAYVAMKKVARRKGTRWIDAAFSPEWRDERLGPLRAGTIWQVWFLAGIVAFFALFLAGT